MWPDSIIRAPQASCYLTYPNIFSLFWRFLTFFWHFFDVFSTFWLSTFCFRRIESSTFLISTFCRHILTNNQILGEIGFCKLISAWNELNKALLFKFSLEKQNFHFILTKKNCRISENFILTNNKNLGEIGFCILISEWNELNKALLFKLSLEKQFW